MKHARSAYQRFQEPEELLTLIRDLQATIEEGREFSEELEERCNQAQAKYALPEGAEPIGEDEPVFLIRARDAFFIPTVANYIMQGMDHNLVYPEESVAPHMMDTLRDHIKRAEAWQKNEGGSRIADMPEEEVVPLEEPAADLQQQ